MFDVTNAICPNLDINFMKRFNTKKIHHGLVMDFRFMDTEKSSALQDNFRFLECIYNGQEIVSF